MTRRPLRSAFVADPWRRRGLSLRGMTLIETAAASALLASALMLSAYLALAVAAIEREAREQQTAREETANALERLTAEPFERLTPDLARRTELSPGVQERMPSAVLTVEIADAEADPVAKTPASKRVLVRFAWRNRRGEIQPAVQAAAWVYPEAE